MMDFKTYSIKEVADWLLAENSSIKLPNIQRGFVWRTAQIENVWDSIFRNFPMGSFLLSKKEDKMEIFDGQQRATSIALGFFNPWMQHKERMSIGNDKSLPTIWLDISPALEHKGNEQIPIVPENSKYLFRVLTKSHPWGYMAKYNKERLYLNDRICAWEQLKKCGKTEYTKLSPTQRAPYQARVPVPLCFLLEAHSKAFAHNTSGNVSVFKEQVVGMCMNSKNIVSSYRPLFLVNENKTYEEGLKGVSDDQWKQLMGCIDDVFNNYKIPAVIIPYDVMRDVKDKSSSDDPTLFVRLNSGGTTLQGEDLIYSIYKAAYPDGKELVESVSSLCNNIIAPSRIIVLASRLVMSDLSGGKYPTGLSSRTFQSLVNDSGFKDCLDKMTKNRLKILFQKAIDILRMNCDGKQHIPDVVVKTFIKDSIDGVMLLLNFLNSIDNLEGYSYYEKIKATICRKLYRNYWFGQLDAIVKDKDNWQRSTSVAFWEDDTIQSGPFHQLPLLPPNRLEEFLISRVRPFEWSDHSILNNSEDEITSYIWSFFRKQAPEAGEDAIPWAWDLFLQRLLQSNTNRNKALILLAQSDYIQREYKDYNQLEDLQDTNTPWDWDHIFPYSWTWGESNLEKAWINRIGNFRAMSLIDNRSENNNLSPKERLSPSDGDNEESCTFLHFLDDYCIKKEGDYRHWKRLTTRCRYVTDGQRTQFEIDYAYAIIKRTVNIYSYFYNLFKIKDGD